MFYTLVTDSLLFCKFDGKAYPWATHIIQPLFKIDTEKNKWGFEHRVIMFEYCMV